MSRPRRLPSEQWDEFSKQFAVLFSSWFDADFAGDDERFARMLAAGFDPDARDLQGATAAMHAAQRGREACLRSLIEAGADLDANDDWGANAAIYAALGGHAGCLRLLVDAGADVDSRGSRCKSVDKVARGECVAVVRALRESRAIAEAAGESSRERGRPKAL